MNRNSFEEGSMVKHSAVLTALLLGLAVAGCDQAKDAGKPPADPEEAKPKAAEPASEAGADSYPLKTCVVSGKELGSMGKPFVATHEGTTVKLCCSGCEKDFKKDPAKYVKMVTDATKKE